MHKPSGEHCHDSLALDLFRIGDKDIQNFIQIKKIRRELETVAPGAVPPATLKPVAPAKGSADSLSTPTTPPATVVEKHAAEPVIDPKDVARFQELRAEIAQLECERVEEFAQAAHERVKQANASRVHAQERIRKADDAVVVANKELKELEDWYLGKNVIGEKKRTEKHEEKAKVAAKAQAEAKAAHQSGNNAKEELTIAQNASRNFNAKVRT